MPDTRKYFYLTRNNKIHYLGNFKNFAEAWEYMEYDADKTFVWIFNETVLKQLGKEIDENIAIHTNI